MQALPWYFDVISPYAYLQLEWLLRDRPELPLEPRPVLLGALLSHFGQLGPAEIPGKREFTYRYVVWRSRELGIPLQFPPRHPFNPLAAMRLIVAAGATTPVVQRVFRHIWEHGRALDDATELADLGAELGIDDVPAAIADPQVKLDLRASTEAAIAAGVYGVPMLVVAGEPFFGQDATPFALSLLEHPHLLREPEFAGLTEIPFGIARR
jgi:2-hydroxychromene-2-carboxylate isomerase